MQVHKEEVRKSNTRIRNNELGFWLRAQANLWILQSMTSIDVVAQAVFGVVLWFSEALHTSDGPPTSRQPIGDLTCCRFTTVSDCSDQVALVLLNHGRLRYTVLVCN